MTSRRNLRLGTDTVCHEGTTPLNVLLAVLIGFVAATDVLRAQDTSKLLYDISTVRQHDLANHGMSWGAQDGYLKATNVTLKNLIADAWGVRPDQVAGEPAWVDDVHWDVTGKVTDAPEPLLKRLTEKDSRRLEQTLLVDRFHVAVHLETRVGTVYYLVPAKAGIKLKALQPSLGGGTSDKNTMPPGSLTMRGAKGGGFEMTGYGLTMGMLISNIAMNLQQTVIDKTGFRPDAVFDFTLTFQPETGTTPPQDGNAVSLRDALEQQLGLRLDATRGPLPTLVVDHVAKPEPN